MPRDLVDLVESERVTVVGAVPTVWATIRDLCLAEGRDISSLRACPVGGSAPPRSLVEDLEKKLDAPMVHAWGMTETTPLGTISRLKSYMLDWTDDQQYTVRTRQGYVVAGVNLRIVDADDEVVPWDGKTMGEIQVRGPWVAAAYYNSPESADRWTEDGWFRTGDVAVIDAEGYIQITDRIKDVIKSGGEWISSIDLENMIVAHPKVLEAAVIGVPHPKWMERPLACVVPRPEHRASLTSAELIDFLRPQVATVLAPGRGRLRRRDPEDQRRQARQEGAARPLQGLAARRRGGPRRHRPVTGAAHVRGAWPDPRPVGSRRRAELPRLG